MSGDLYDDPFADCTDRECGDFAIWGAQIRGTIPTPIPVRPKPYDHETDGL
jgi:hypothetical protein